MLEEMSHEAKCHLFTLGAMHELADQGVLKVGETIALTDAGIALFDQLKAAGFRQTVEEQRACLLYLMANDARGRRAMTTTDEAATMADMPRQKRTPAMTAADFRALLAAAGLTIRQAAEKLGVGNATVSRWQSGVTNIAASSAKLIRATIKPPKK